MLTQLVKQLTNFPILAVHSNGVIGYLNIKVDGILLIVHGFFGRH